MENETQLANPYRRNFLKFLLIGGGAFIVGRFANPFINFWNGDKVLDERNFQDFKIVETGKTLKVFDKEGKEVIIVEKDSF